MKIQTSIFYFFNVLVLISLLSCNSGPKEIKDPVKAQSSIPKTPEQKSQALKVNVFLEVSGGMVGFMPKGSPATRETEFQANVASLLANVNHNKDIKSKNFYYIKEKDGNSELVKENYQQVLNTVSGGVTNPALGTELPEMLEQILRESNKSDAVSVVVSDFIYGPANKTKYNIIPQLVQGALNDVQNKDLVISVFGYKSAFHGSYHPAVKTPAEKVPLLGTTKIPFYIWVIGKQQDVMFFNKNVLNDTPLEQVHYGFNYTIPDYEALPQFNSSGTIYCSTSSSKGGCKSVILKAENGEPAEFEIGVNLLELPSTLQSPIYLKDNLKISGKGINAAILEVKKSNNQTVSDSNLDKYSHFIRVRVNQLTVDKGNLTLTLTEKEPLWITGWSTSNDNDPVANPGKTFKLKEILGGVAKLYPTSNKNESLLSINFTKEQ